MCQVGTYMDKCERERTYYMYIVSYFPFYQVENLCLLSGAVAVLTAFYSKSCDQVGVVVKSDLLSIIKMNI